MEKTMELNNDELEEVSGGTIFANYYSKSKYQSFGICTRYHPGDRDEFIFMGHVYNEETANKIVKIGENLLMILNAGREGNNCIRPDEPAFQQAFNTQLAFFGFVQWDGKPGHDC